MATFAGKTSFFMSNEKRRKAYEWGLTAEKLATEHLLREGYTIREQRWRPGPGHAEIDIIAELPGVLVFVEVKARTPEEGETREDWMADPAAPAEAVNARKRRMIARASDIYLRSQERDYEYRYDIITLLGNPDDFLLTHIPDAFISPVLTK